MDIAITKMSSKGQIVIPQEMRKDIPEGQKLMIIKTKRQIIIEKTSVLDEKLKEDFAFAKKVKEAWKKYDRGEFTSSSAEDFLKELDKW